MKQPNTRMMDRIAEIENCVLGGLVLDDRETGCRLPTKEPLKRIF